MPYCNRKAFQRRNYNLIIEPTPTCVGVGALTFFNVGSPGINGAFVPPYFFIPGDAAAEKARFLSYLTVSGVIDFERYSQVIGSPPAQPLDLNGMSDTSNGNVVTYSSLVNLLQPDFALGNDVIPPGFGRFSTDPYIANPGGGGQWARMVGFNRPGVTMNFTTPIAAFGTYITDFGDFGLDPTDAMIITLTKFGGGTVSVTGADLPAKSATEGNCIWWGFVDRTGTTYTSITFSVFQAAIDTDVDIVGFDGIILASLAQTMPACS